MNTLLERTTYPVRLGIFAGTTILAAAVAVGCGRASPERQQMTLVEQAREQCAYTGIDYTGAFAGSGFVPSYGEEERRIFLPGWRHVASATNTSSGWFIRCSESPGPPMTGVPEVMRQFPGGTYPPPSPEDQRKFADPKS